MRQRIIAAMPLISLLLFLYSGFVLEQWWFGVTFFALIPLSTLLLSKHPWRRIAQAMPLISVLLFLWLALGFGLAHPGWMVFFLIPLSEVILNGRIDVRKGVAIAITAVYITLGFIFDIWHPGWLIFLLIPIINTLFFPGNNIFQFKAMNIKKHVRDYVEIVDED